MRSSGTKIPFVKLRYFKGGVGQSSDKVFDNFINVVDNKIVGCRKLPGYFPRLALAGRGIADDVDDRLLGWLEEAYDI